MLKRPLFLSREVESIRNSFTYIHTYVDDLQFSLQRGLFRYELLCSAGYLFLQVTWHVTWHRNRNLYLQGHTRNNIILAAHVFSHTFSALQRQLCIGGQVSRVRSQWDSIRYIQRLILLCSHNTIAEWSTSVPVTVVLFCEGALYLEQCGWGKERGWWWNETCESPASVS